MKLTVLFTVGVIFMNAQSPIEYSRCVETIPAYGDHVTFAPEDALQSVSLKLAELEIYNKWEMASRSMSFGWFEGPKPVSLAYIKSHMPRAMLLQMHFPVDQNPPVKAVLLADLLAAESAYKIATKALQAYPKSLMEKYGVGPEVRLDQDGKGMTPVDGCKKWETVAYPFSEKTLPIK